MTRADRIPGLILDRGPRVRRAILAFTVAFTPLFFLWDVTNDAFNVPKLALVVAGVALAGAMRVAETVLGLSLAGRRTLLVPAAFVAVPLIIGWAFSPYRAWSLLGAYTRYEGLVPMLLIVALGLLVADAFAGRPRMLAWAIAVGGAGTGLYLLIQSIGLDPLDAPAPVTGFQGSSIGHSNFAGGYLAVCLPVAAALWLEGEGSKRWAQLAVILISLGVLFSGSQGGWAATAAGGAVLLGLMLRDRWPYAMRVGATLAGLAAAVVVGVVVISLVSPDSTWVGDTSRARGLWWQMAVDMTADSPVVGRGPNAFAIEGAHYRQVEDDLAHGRVITDSPHSVFFSFLTGAGALGGLGFLLLVAWVVRQTGRARTMPPLAMGFTAALIAYLVQSLVSMDQVVLAVALWTSIGGLLAFELKPAELRGGLARAGGGRTFLACMILLGSLSSLWWGIRFVVADAHINQAADLYDEGRPDASLVELEAALELRDNSHYRALYATFLGEAALRAQESGEHFFERSLAQFRALDHLPDVRNMGDEARIRHDWSPIDRTADLGALVVVRRALALDPYHPDLKALEAEILLNLDRPGEAQSSLAPMLPLLERYPTYGRQYPKLWALSAIAHHETGDLEQAAALLAEGIEQATLVGRESTDCHILTAQAVLTDDPEGASGLLICPESLVQLLPET